MGVCAAKEAEPYIPEEPSVLGKNEKTFSPTPPTDEAPTVTEALTVTEAPTVTEASTRTESSSSLPELTIPATKALRPPPVMPLGK